jgi:ribonucleoside-diphosphate reductase alpha chain
MEKIATTPLNERVWQRYLRPGETVADALRRVATYVAENGETAIVEENPDGAIARDLRVATYYDLMASGSFLPNSPTLMNAGKQRGRTSSPLVSSLRWTTT